MDFFFLVIIRNFSLGRKLVIFPGKFNFFFLWVKDWFLEVGVKSFFVSVFFFFLNRRNFWGRNFIVLGEPVECVR